MKFPIVILVLLHICVVFVQTRHGSQQLADSELSTGWENSLSTFSGDDNAQFEHALSTEDTEGGGGGKNRSKRMVFNPFKKFIDSIKNKLNKFKRPMRPIPPYDDFIPNKHNMGIITKPPNKVGKKPPRKRGKGKSKSKRKAKKRNRRTTIPGPETLPSISGQIFGYERKPPLPGEVTPIPMYRKPTAVTIPGMTPHPIKRRPKKIKKLEIKTNKETKEIESNKEAQE